MKQFSGNAELSIGHKIDRLVERPDLLTAWRRRWDGQISVHRFTPREEVLLTPF